MLIDLPFMLIDSPFMLIEPLLDIIEPLLDIIEPLLDIMDIEPLLDMSLLEVSPQPYPQMQSFHFLGEGVQLN